MSGHSQMLLPVEAPVVPRSARIRVGVETVEGLVETLQVRENADGGTWMVGTLQEDDDEPVRFVGADLPADLLGTVARLRGEWRVDKVYGLQLHVSAVSRAMPLDRMATIRYLATNLRGYGCGEQRAALLYDRLYEPGADVLAVLAKNPARAREIFAGQVGERMSEGLAAWALATTTEASAQRIMVRLMTHGITYGLARRIAGFYGGEVGEILARRDPYQLTEVPGVGWETADRLGTSLGIPPDAEARVAAALQHVLEEAEGKEGHVALPVSVLVERTRDLLAVPTPRIEQVVYQCLEDALLWEEHGLVYTGRSYETERRLAFLLLRLSHIRRPLTPEQRQLVLRVIAESKLEPEQADAIWMGLEFGVSVLTGRPGSGKTTTASTYVRCCEALEWSVRIAAPTGKAAARATNVTGVRASTIHRLIGGTPGRVGDQPISSRVVICDEWSMVDQHIARWLLDNVDPATTSLLICGDAEQLPSVGPGTILRDMLDAGSIASTALVRVHRHASDSLIVQNANALLDGSPLVLPSDPGGDFVFHDVSRGRRARGKAAYAAEQRLAVATLESTLARLTANGIEVRQDVQVLSPMIDGVIGVDALNRRLQDLLNPKGRRGPKIGGRAHVRVGDRVIQTVNDYDVEGALLNGEQGVVTAVGDGMVRLEIDEGKEEPPRTVTLHDVKLLHLRLAWAITVHRAQGSEYPCVILFYHDVHEYMLQTALLYTAMTRARTRLIILGTPTALRLSEERTMSRVRHTGLARRLRPVR